MRVMFPRVSASFQRYASSAVVQEEIRERLIGFQDWITGIEQRVKKLLQTEHDLFLFAGTGSGGLESALVNMFSPRDKVVFLVMGEGGKQWAEIADIFCLETVRMGVEWGRSIDTQDLDLLLSRGPGKGAKGVCITHNELSTGISTDIEGIANVCAQNDILCLVNAEHSLAAADLQTDKWGGDVVVCALPGGLLIPEGLTFLSISPKAHEYAHSAASSCCYWSLERALNRMDKDLKKASLYSNAPMLYALEKALDLAEDEGVQNAFERHKVYSQAIRQGIEAMGLELLVKDQARASPVATAVMVPEGVNKKKMYDHLGMYGIFTDNSPSRLEGMVFSIVHLGYLDITDISHILVVLGLAFRTQGVAVNVEAGLQTVWEVLRYEQN